MSLWPSFIGPAYRARSQSIAADELINLYTEATELPGAIKTSTFYGTPGLKPLLTVPSQRCRGSFSQDGRTFTVVGATFYELDLATLTAQAYGTIADDGQPVSMASNGRAAEQLMIVGGGQVKMFKLTTNILSAAIVLPFVAPPVMIDYMDGYFLLSLRGSLSVYFSNLDNGLVWDALDFFVINAFSTNVVGIKVFRDRLWVFGSQAAAVYYDVGNADNPFVIYPGSVMQEGLVSPWAVALQGEALYWQAQDNLGGNRFVMALDYAPTVISTPPISFALASYATTTDVEVLTYEQEGHPFVCWTFPTSGETLAWDVREQQWHKRDTFDEPSGQGVRWRARGLCAVGALLVVGDYATGDLYTLDLDTFTDNGGAIRRLRRAPYLSAENQWLFLDSFEVGMQVGVGTSGQGLSPELVLRVSRDSAQTWTPPTTTTVGAQGEYTNRAVWHRLGRSRADRLVLEVTMTDPVRCVMGPGAWLQARAGSGRL